MPVFLPFCGLRYRGRTDVSSVVAPPYDVIDAAERDRLETRDPHNAVRLILPREPGADPATTDGHRSDRYAAAAARLAAWQADGTLGFDDHPALYAYRMTYTDRAGRARVTHGVIGALGLPADAGTGDILPHERTIAEHRGDRLALLDATRANLDPIWGLATAPDVPDLAGEPGPDRQWAQDDDGVLHECWAIRGPDRIEPISAAIAAGPLVLADGHHRFETACAYRAAHPDDPGAAAIMTLVVALADDELSVAPIHRVVRGAPHLRHRLTDAFEVRSFGDASPAAVRALEVAMVEVGALGLLDRSGAALLVPRPEVTGPALEAEPPEVRAVDAALFEAVVSPRLDGAALEYRSDAATVAALVERGHADAAILLRPVGVDQIRAAAEAGVRMPQKTTFFAPKPRTGFVFRSLDR